MKQLLCKENIFLNLESLSKEEAIRLAGQKLFENGYINKEYIEAMIEREKITSTYLGMGFAIPHGVNEAKKNIKNSGIVILQFPNGIDFDGELAYILIAMACKNNEHIEMLSHISVIIDEDLNEKLKNEQDKEIFLSIFCK